MSRLVLDTGILLGLVLDKSWPALDSSGARDQTAVRLTSIVCHGELLSISKQRAWGSKKRARVESVLNAIQAASVGSRHLLDVYAHMDAWSRGKQQGPAGEPPIQPSRKMGKNDLWIAATAHLARATLLSTDKDFAHMHGVWFDYRFVRPP